MGEIIMLLIIGGVGTYYYFETLSYKVPSFELNGGPAIFPQLILLLLGVAIVVRIIQVLRSKNRKPFVLLNLFSGTRAIFFIGFIAYVITLPLFGYLLGTFLYLTITCNLFLYKMYKSCGSVKKVVIREFGFLAGVMAIYFIFTQLLTVMVPVGILGF